MNINEKLEVLNLNLNGIDAHIRAIEADIALYPNSDTEDKPLRAEVLLEFQVKKLTIQNMIIATQ